MRIRIISSHVKLFPFFLWNPNTFFRPLICSFHSQFRTHSSDSNTLSAAITSRFYLQKNHTIYWASCTPMWSNIKVPQQAHGGKKSTQEMVSRLGAFNSKKQRNFPLKEAQKIKIKWSATPILLDMIADGVCARTLLTRMTARSLACHWHHLSCSLCIQGIDDMGTRKVAGGASTFIPSHSIRLLIAMRGRGVHTYAATIFSSTGSGRDAGAAANNSPWSGIIISSKGVSDRMS
jgi:hypothetical protein